MQTFTLVYIGRHCNCLYMDSYLASAAMTLHGRTSFFFFSFLKKTESADGTEQRGSKYRGTEQTKS